MLWIEPNGDRKETGNKPVTGSIEAAAKRRRQRRMSLSEDIKDFGLDLGYSKVAITTGNSFPAHLEKPKARYDMHG